MFLKMDGWKWERRTGPSSRARQVSFISDFYLNLNLKKKQIKAVESPITRIFGGRFKSTLRAPGQRDSVLTEDWRSLRLDIQVSSASASSSHIDICPCPARYGAHDSRSPHPPNSPPTHPNDAPLTTGRDDRRESTRAHRWVASRAGSACEAVLL